MLTQNKYSVMASGNTYLVHNRKRYLQKQVSESDLRKWFTNSLKRIDKNKHIVVFDIDETLFLNNDDNDKVKPNHVVLTFCKKCIKQGIPVYLITARRDSDENRAWTKGQLKTVGLHEESSARPGYKKLYMRPASYRSTHLISKFKKCCRKRIAQKEGKLIYVNVGDQWSDVFEFPNEKEFDNLVEADNRSYFIIQPVNEEYLMYSVKLRGDR